MAATIFRLTGFDTEGDLELSAAQLYAGAERADLGATITSSHAPIGGALNNLSDADLNTVCRFAARDVRTPGFYIQWSLAAAAEVSRIRLATGDDVLADTKQVTLAAVGSRAPRTWSGLQTTGRRQWYVEAPASMAIRLPLIAEVIESSSTTAMCALPENCTAGDYLLAFVMHRSALTTPPGWTLLRLVGPVTDGVATQQWQTLLGKVASSDDYGGSLMVTQASAGRLILGVVGIDTKGASVATQVASDAASGVDNQYVDAISTTITPGSVAVASATVVSVVSEGNPWAYIPAPPQTTPLFGGLGGRLHLRLVAAISATGGVFGPRFMAPNSVQYNDAGVTKITVTVNPLAGSPVLKEGLLKLRTRGISVLQLTGAEPPAQGPGSTQRIPAPGRVLDAEFGGFYRIYGTVARKGTPSNVPLKRRVRLHRSKDGYLVRETWSQPDGSFEFKEISGRYEYDVIAWDHEMQEFSTVANNQLPEAMP